MATIVTRTAKGLALTWAEGDANFTNLNDAKIEAENTGTADQVLTRTSTGAAWADAAAGGLTALVDDTTPQLGGVLDTNGHAIEGYTTTITGSNSVVLQGGSADSITLGGGAINLKPNVGTNTKIVLEELYGSGNITLLANGVIDISTTDTLDMSATTLKLNNLTYPAADGTANQVLTTNGSGALSWSTVSTATALDDLTDVTITTPATNDTIMYDGAGWVNTPAPVGYTGSAGANGSGFTSQSVGQSFATDGSITGTNVNWYVTDIGAFAAGNFVNLIDNTSGSTFYYYGKITLIQFAGGFGWAVHADVLGSDGTANGSPSSAWNMVLTGSRGPTGYTGSAGAIGYTGSTGDIGYTGSASTVPGYTGSQGTIGYTGSNSPGAATINDASTTSFTETWSANKLYTTLGDIQTALTTIIG